MCSTCSSRRIIRTISRIPARRRRRHMTSPAGRWRIRWACSSTAFSTHSTGRSRKFKDRVAAAAGPGARRRERGRLLPGHAHERFVPRGEPLACRRPRRAAAEGAVRRRGLQPIRPGIVLHPNEGLRRRRCLEKLAAETGHAVSAAATSRPGRKQWPLSRCASGLWDRYGGSMPSGWTRWLLEHFEFPFKVVFPPELDQGGLPREVRRADFVGRRDSRSAAAGMTRAAPSAATPLRPTTTEPHAEQNSGRGYRGRRGTSRWRRPSRSSRVSRKRRHDPDHRHFDKPRARSALPLANHLVRRRRMERNSRCRAKSSTCRAHCSA